MEILRFIQVLIGASAIAKYNGGKLKLQGNTSIYAVNEGKSTPENARACVSLHESGTDLEFNSTGNFFAGGYVASTLYGSRATYDIIKGHFASLSSEYMFFENNETIKTNYIGSATKKKYVWMNSLTTTASKELNCYYYKKGI